MAGSTTNLDTIATAQAQKEVTANALFDAMSPAGVFGRRASTCAALTWGYYGGAVRVAGSSDGLTQVANGTLTLAASDTNYIEVDAEGVVSANTVGFSAGATPLYEVVTGADAVTSYTDWRIIISGLSGEVISVNGQTGPVVLAAADLAITDVGGHFTATEIEGALQELAAELLALPGGAGTVTNTGGDLTAYALLVGAGGDDAAALASLGTAGQSLASAGPGAPPVWASAPFDVHAYYPGTPTSSAKVLRVPVARAVSFAANFSGSYFKASANATASTVFDVQKNGSSIGTVTIAASGTTATFATSGGTAQTFAAGDLLAIIAPASPDATLADVGFVLAGTR